MNQDESSAATHTSAPLRSRLARRLGRVIPRGTGFESTRNLTKWLIFGTAIGIVAGAGAAAFFIGIEWATKLFLGVIAGYAPPGTAGEGVMRVVPAARPWLLPVVTTAGGLLSGIIVFSLAPEAEGHGTDAAIEAIHRRGGNIRARIPPVKLVASAITIGSGGSGGREGPAAQISAAFGSLLGRWFLADPQDRRIAVAAGIGAGIGAIFRAPLGGAVLAAEILYVHDIEVEAIIPSLIASIVGYTVYGAWMGYGAIFGTHATLELGAPIQLAYYGVLGALSGAGGLLYARTFYGITAAFHRLALPRWLKPALGGLAVGLIGMLLPQVLHTGYGWVQLSMTKEGLLALSPLVVLALPFGKVLATSLTIGSGGSGGIFGPGMVIGGMLGALLWRVGYGVLPNLPPEPAPFVIIGMMALFGGIAHAPLAVMLMVAEMTGTLSLLAPAMIAVAVSTALVGDEKIYRAQLLSRASSPFHRARLSFPVLSTLLVRDASESARVVLPESTAAAEAQRRLEEAGEKAALVVGADAVPIGAVTIDGLRQLPPGDRNAPLGAVTARVLLRADQALDDAMEALADVGAAAAAVTGEDGARTLVTSRGILRAYRAALQRDVRRAAALPRGMLVLHVRVDPGWPIAGRCLGDAGLPPDLLVVSIDRAGEAILPRAATRLEPGDVLAVVTTRRGEADVRTLLSGGAHGDRPAG